MNIILKRNYHGIPESEREYGCECKYCGTIFTFTGSEARYEMTAVDCPTCKKCISNKEWTWLRNKKEVEQFTKLHKALNEES